MTLYFSIYGMLDGMESPRFQFVRFHSVYCGQLISPHESPYKTVQEKKLVATTRIVVLQRVLKIAEEKKIINVLVTLLEKTQCLLFPPCHSRHFSAS